MSKIQPLFSQCEKLNKLLFSIGILILRIGVGLAMMSHGLAKMDNYSAIVQSGNFLNFMHLGLEFSLCLAIFTEVVCSIFLIFGFLTRIASFLLACTMLVAIFIVHANDPFAKGWELAFMYLLPYITLILTGGSCFSVDRLICTQYLMKKCEKKD